MCARARARVRAHNFALPFIIVHVSGRAYVRARVRVFVRNANSARAIPDQIEIFLSPAVPLPCLINSQNSNGDGARARARASLVPISSRYVTINILISEFAFRQCRVQKRDSGSDKPLFSKDRINWDRSVNCGGKNAR